MNKEKNCKGGKQKESEDKKNKVKRQSGKGVGSGQKGDRIRKDLLKNAAVTIGMPVSLCTTTDPPNNNIAVTMMFVIRPKNR